MLQYVCHTLLRAASLRLFVSANPETLHIGEMYRQRSETECISRLYGRSRHNSVIHTGAWLTLSVRLTYTEQMTKSVVHFCGMVFRNTSTVGCYTCDD